MLIGKLAKQGGVPTKTIGCCKDNGLLPASDRKRLRRYGAEAADPSASYRPEAAMVAVPLVNSGWLLRWLPWENEE